MIAKDFTSAILNEVNKYANCNPNVGLLLKIEHKLQLKSTHPINIKEYPIPNKLVDETKKELNKLMKLNIIRKSLSDYASPAFPVLKKDGTIRLVVDYRALNKLTIPAPYPFPELRYQML
jgi:predicted P-loop ATPase/GTPase